MPSQVVQTIDELFPHAARNMPDAVLGAGGGSQYLGILNLLKDVPDELIILTPANYSELVLAKSTIEEHLAHWRSRGNVGNTAHVKGFDVVTVIRRALAKCPDGFVYATKGSYERAIQDFNRAINLAPNSAEALLNRGITKLKRGDYMGGRADIAQAKLMKPDIDE